MSSMSKKNFGLTSSLEEEVMVIKKQGIVSILGYSDSEKNKAASLRRTLSADMSSQKWLSQHGFSPLKKIASSEEFPVSSSEEEEEEEELEEPENRRQFEIWNSIQHQQQNNNQKLAGQFDIWSSIVSAKQECNNNNNVPPPYIHPLVKRSASSLSEKSLQICTESLGSETGSDGFSSYPASETEDEQGEPEEVEEEKEFERFEDLAFPVEKYSKKTALPRSFPPPLPSLSRGDGASLHMRPRRDNGRLVLEAVSVPSQNNFLAERQDGRLVLTFINNEEEGEEEAMKSEEKSTDVGLFRVDLDSEEEEEGTESETEADAEAVAEEVKFPVPKLGGGVMNVHRLALMMNKSVVLANRNPTWPNKFNNEEGEEMEEDVLNPITPLTQSLPPRPPVGRMIPITPAAAAKAAAGATGVGAGAGSLNAYEYYWKAKPMAATTATVLISPLAQNPTISKNIIASNEKQELLVLRGNKGDNYLLPLSSKSCKQPRRSLLFWEPYCIATS